MELTKLYAVINRHYIKDVCGTNQKLTAYGFETGDGRKVDCVTLK